MRKVDVSINLLLLLTLIFPAAAQKPSQEITVNEFPTFGCIIGVPNGWQRIHEMNDADVGRWIYKRLETGAISVGFVLQMQPSGKENLQQSAEDLLKQFHGKQSDTALTLDGKPALRLHLEKGQPGFPQHQTIISQNNGQNYLLDLYAAAGEDANAVIDAVVKNWKWIPFAPPADHLQFRKDTISLFKNSVTLQIPEIMRPVQRDADKLEKFGIYDYRSGALPFVTIVDVVPLQGALSFIELRDNFTTLIRDQFKVKEKIIWTGQKSSLPSYLSSSFAAPDAIKSAAEKKYSIYNRYGLVKLDQAKVALLTFTVTVQTAEGRKKYDDTIRRILDSVSTVPLKK